MLKLLGKRSSINVRKVLWAADELALELEQEDWGSGFRATDDAAFLALNPNAQVPVLIDGEFVLWESNSICRYLATRAGRQDLLPQDAQGRARVEQWMDWQATDLNTAWRYAFMARVRSSARHQDAAQIDQSVQEWNRLMQILDRQLQGRGPYLLGDHFTLADVVIGLSVQRWMMTPIPRPELPAVAAYYATLSERPAFLRHGRNGLP